MKVEAKTALAWSTRECLQCEGTGLIEARKTRICACVRRHIFRACLKLYRESLSCCQIRTAIYRADFLLTVQHSIDREDLPAFEMAFLDEEPYAVVAPALHMDKGNYFHWIYQTEERVGEALAERGVFPLRAYFAGPGWVGARGRSLQQQQFCI